MEYLGPTREWKEDKVKIKEIVRCNTKQNTSLKKISILKH
jgi:Zn ribbon nucleic-acid-binding protein